MSAWKCHQIHCRADNPGKVKKCWKCGEARRDKKERKRKQI